MAASCLFVTEEATKSINSSLHGSVGMAPSLYLAAILAARSTNAWPE